MRWTSDAPITEFDASKITGPMRCIGCHGFVYHLPPFGMYEKHYLRLSKRPPRIGDIGIEYRPHKCSERPVPHGR